MDQFIFIWEFNNILGGNADSMASDPRIAAKEQREHNVISNLSLWFTYEVFTNKNYVLIKIEKHTYTLLPLVVALRLIFVATIVSPSSEILQQNKKWIKLSYLLNTNLCQSNQVVLVEKNRFCTPAGYKVCLLRKC